MDNGIKIWVKGKSPRNKEGLPSPKCSLDPTKVLWSDEVRKEVI